MRTLARRLRHIARASGTRLACRLFATPEGSPAWRAVFAAYSAKQAALALWRSPTLLGRRGRPTWRADVRRQFVHKLHLLAERRYGSACDLYAHHRRNHRLGAGDRRRLRDAAAGFGHRPLMSIVVPVYDAKAHWLERLVASVREQLYDRWELVLVDDASPAETTRSALRVLAATDPRIRVLTLPANGGVSRATNAGVENAEGEFLVFADHDDELMPDALWHVAHRLQTEPDVDLLYSDEELVPEEGPPVGQFKPAWSPERLLSHNVPCHLVVMRATLFRAVGGLRPETDGAQDYDLLLRASRLTDRIVHIPRVLYRWHLTAGSVSRGRSDGRAIEQRSRIDGVTRRVVQDHLDELGMKATVEVRDHWAWPRFHPDPRGKVSVVICTKDNPRQLARCVASIERHTRYPDFEIVVVDNGAASRRGRAVLADVATRHRVLPIASGPEGFNFSRLNNEAVRHVDGRFLLFLNDDTEVLADGWLSAMVQVADRPGVGAVGARLLFPGRRNQHSGVIVGAMGWGPWHALRGDRADGPDHGGYMTHLHNAAAVTGACLMTQRDTFLAHDGFDEDDFAVSFNDIDYCLRLHAAGLRSAVVPQAELIHHEHQTRPRTLNARESAAMARRYRGFADPYWNANLSRQCDHFSVAPRRRPIVVGDSAPAPVRVLVCGDPEDRRTEWPDLFARLESRGVCRQEVHAGIDADTRMLHDVTVVVGGARAEWVRAAAAAGSTCLWLDPCDATTDIPPWAHRRLIQALDLPYQVVFGSTLDRLRAESGRRRPNFTVIENVAHEPPPSPVRTAAEGTDVRRRLGIGDDRALLVVPLLPEDHGVAELAAASFLRLPRRLRAAATLLLVGPGPVGNLKRLIRNRGDDVQSIATDADIAPCLSAADAVIAHPASQSRPRYALEAMRRGVPMIGNDLLAWSETVHPEGSGLTVRRWSRRELTGAMRRLLADPVLRRRLGEQSFHWLASRTHPETVLADWATLLREAADLHASDRRPAERPAARVVPLAS